MLKKFEISDGVTVTVEVSKEGKATYSVGKKKTVFDLSECESIVYEFQDESAQGTITENMLNDSEYLLWLVITEGESRLEYNSNQTETRRHFSYSDDNDKSDTLESGKDALYDLIGKENLKEVLESLEPQQQDLIMNIYHRGLSMAEIARREGVNESAIRDRIRKINKKLKKFF